MAAIKTNQVISLDMLTGGAQREVNKINTPQDLYARVPLVWRAARLRCNTLQMIPRHLYTANSMPQKQTEIDWMFETDLAEIIWLTEASLLFAGHALILQNANDYGYVRDLEWLNPFTVKVDFDRNSGKRLFSQMVNGIRYPSTGYWTEDEVVYLREFSFRDDVGAGDSAAANAMGDGQLAHYTTRMAGIFFEHGAMPVTLITAPNGFGQDTEQVQNFFNRMIAGIRNFSRTLALRGAGIEVHTVQSVLKDLAIPDLDEKARKNVARAFEIPVTLLDSDETMATAEIHNKTLYDSTVVPRAVWMDAQFNKQLLKPLGYRLETAWNELDIYKEDERANSESAKRFQEILNGARSYDEWLVTVETYGIDVSDDHKVMIQKAFATREQRAADVQAQMTPPNNAPQASPNLQPQQKSMSELEQWERKALKRLREHGSLADALDFKAATIAPTLRASIVGALAGTTDAARVRRVFADAARWQGYP